MRECGLLHELRIPQAVVCSCGSEQKHNDERSAACAGAKYADNRQHQGTPNEWNYQAYTQAPRVSGNYSHKRRHERTAQRRQREHHAAYFSCAHAIPFGEPCDKNWKNTRESKPPEKSPTKQRELGMTGQKNGLPHGCKEKSCNGDGNFFQVKKNGSRGAPAP